MEWRFTWLDLGDTLHTAALSATRTAISSAIMLARPYPNPSRGGFSVAFSVPDARPARLELFDINGRLRFSHSYVGPGGFLFTLPAKAIEPGVYFLRLAGSRGSATQRVAVAP
jgi:hypothetical protein